MVGDHTKYSHTKYYAYLQMIFQNNQNRYAAEQIWMGAFDKTMFTKAFFKGEIDYF